MSKREIIGQEIDVTAASGGVDLDTFDLTELFLICRITALTGGTTPTVDFNLVAYDDAGVETTVVLNALGAALNAVGAVANGGCGVNISQQIPPKRSRLNWTTTGAPTSAKAYISGWGLT